MSEHVKPQTLGLGGEQVTADQNATPQSTAYGPAWGPDDKPHDWDYPESQSRHCVRCMKTDAEIGGLQWAPCKGRSDTTEDELTPLGAYERGRRDERARCVAKVKHWFGGDSIGDRGYECVREIENG